MMTLMKMKLYGSLTSPFVRKIRVAVEEYGLGDRVELAVTDPWQSPADLLNGNPLAKVPALVTEDGLTLPDSELIMNYLDTLTGRAGSAQAGGYSRDYWETARLVQLADGVIDAAVAIVIETLKRPKEFIYSGWVDRQNAAITRSLEALESAAERLADGSAAPIGRLEITLGTALAYVDFRMPKQGWRERCPNLVAWFTRFATRPSMLATQPPV